MDKPRWVNGLLLAFCGLLITQPALSRNVSERAPSGLLLKADYHEGQQQLPAVLILHGFLTTHQFSTVQNLGNALAEAGYPVLTPTLSLGISGRSAPLACDAIHTHRLEQELEEIQSWVEWLIAQGHRQVVLIGYSTGSIPSVAYAAGKPHPALAKVIAVSLSYFDAINPPHVVSRQMDEARRQAARNDQEPGRYALLYCSGNFLTPPKNYLGYLEWSSQRVTQAIARRKIPINVIMGGADTDFVHGWLEGVRKAGVDVEIIEEANHFFSNATEFSLHDHVLNDLTGGHL